MNLNYNVNSINFKEGTVIIAGAGPGNIKLVTIKTILALKSADVVIYDSLINKALLEYCKKNVKSRLRICNPSTSASVAITTLL